MAITLRRHHKVTLHALEVRHHLRETRCYDSNVPPDESSLLSLSYCRTLFASIDGVRVLFEFALFGTERDAVATVRDPLAVRLEPPVRVFLLRLLILFCRIIAATPIAHTKKTINPAPIAPIKSIEFIMFGWSPTMLLLATCPSA